MSVRARPWPVLAGILALPFAAMTLPLAAQTEPAKLPPAVGAATGSLTVAGKRVALTHAIAFNAGARIYVAITDQALPPDETRSEFELAKYQFLHKVVGLELTLDHTRQVTETAYRWDLARTPCAGCFEVTLAGEPDGPLTGTIRTTAKGDAEKLKVDVAFSAPFAKPSAAK
jgi:hypothetical protein